MHQAHHGNIDLHD